jgi:alpha,alpha-trehalase
MRNPDQETKGTLIPLPNSYIVPGGRFGEIYYWDSYFTMLGLQAAGRTETIENMVDNFAYLIETIGFIPNGNRSYFLTRSQPPFFSLMVDVLAEQKGDDVYTKYLPALQKEYDFWMNGGDKVSATMSAFEHVVQLTDDDMLNRYWDSGTRPRAESYKEDVELLEHSTRTKGEVYQHLRAACESGWDFSSRWFKDGQTLGTIHTMDILPVDLNSLLYNLEKTIAHAYELKGEKDKKAEFENLAQKRKTAISTYHWNNEMGYFMDYDFVEKQLTDKKSLAGVFPLFFNVADQNQADEVAKMIKSEFLQPGGVVTSLAGTGQQWDLPNGWAPLQWIGIQGLKNYGFDDLAKKISNNWVKLNTDVYHRTGKLLEKYNVEDTSLLSGGGEYEVQDGFGWTNGVLLKLMSD